MGMDEEQKRASLESLEKQLAEVKKHAPQTNPNVKLPGDAARSAIDFASASAVGTILGYGFDRWQDTLPWGLLVGLLIGTGAGLKLMFQNEARERAKSGADKKDNA